ncbi:diguanylate cyclase [Thalassobaculum sp.]|uniref:diguanylate cyclase n=1 Tax=Thalassobaculum sp. TaxID=2022740 RepID=UPI0032EB8260
MVTDPEVNEVGQIADEALGHMSVLGIPPTPENFAVWFAYANRSDRHLCRTIDILRDNGQEFDSIRNADLHARFIMPLYQSEEIETVADGLHAVAGQLSTTVADAGDGTRTYGRALSDISDALTRTESVDSEMHRLVGSLVHETRVMEARNTRLHGRLEKSAEEIARLRKSLVATRREASTDGLTGLANRMQFERELRSAAAKAMEHGTTLCLLMADIDHFKTFNDTYGHMVGDQVLRLVGRVLIEAIRPNDLAARFGGEEFVVILPDCCLDEATRIAERIRERIGEKHVVRRRSGDDLGTVTLSLGVTAYQPGESLGQFIERADSGLYDAKQAGRNRVSVVGEPSGRDAGGVRSVRGPAQ